MKKESFKIIVLGSSGGPKESNLTGYLLAPHGISSYIALDAGTLLSGIEVALSRNTIEIINQDPTLTPLGNFFLHQIKGYLISHAHFDHIAGLVINSQIDLPFKPLMGIDSTIDHLRDHIFNHKIWPNYGNEGVRPLNHYLYVRLKSGKPVSIPNTSMNVEAFPLSHPKDYLSSVFLIGHNGNYVVYFGDTSSDEFEEKKRLKVVWERIAPLVKEKALKGILLECSYSMKEAAQVIYGHLDPRLMVKELTNLANLSHTSLKETPIIVTHRKDAFKLGQEQKEIIAQELSHLAAGTLRLIFPSQGDVIDL